MVLEMYHKNFKYLPWLESIEVAMPNNWYFRFFLKMCGNFEPLYLSNKSKFWKIKKGAFSLWPWNVSQKFQTSAMDRKYRSGQADNLCVDNKKSPFSGVLCVFSGTAQDFEK